MKSRAFFLLCITSSVISLQSYEHSTELKVLPVAAVVAGVALGAACAGKNKLLEETVAYGILSACFCYMSAKCFGNVVAPSEEEVAAKEKLNRIEKSNLICTVGGVITLIPAITLGAIFGEKSVKLYQQ